MRVEKKDGLGEILHWIAMGSHRSAISYYIGELARDIDAIAKDSPLGMELRAIRHAIWEAYRRFEIELVQRKLPSGYEYIAIKRSKEGYKHGKHVKRIQHKSYSTEPTRTLEAIPDTGVSSLVECGTCAH